MKEVSQQDGKAPEGSEWDWTKAQLLPEGRWAPSGAYLRFSVYDLRFGC